MSKIDAVIEKIGDSFHHLSGPSYVRLLDTPRVWGMPFGDEIMEQARVRQEQFERAIVEIVQKARYRCDLASLNTPDPQWVRPMLGAIDTALTKNVGRAAPTQFRFLFGQTPLSPVFEPPNYIDFKGALIRMIRLRSRFWEQMPEIWLGRFYRFQAGVFSTLEIKFLGDNIFCSDDTKMTWNHSKIVVVDGTEAIVGGHNLNMDLFRSYPPVHDVSVVVHGDAAYGSQLFLNEMWNCGPDLITKEYLDATDLSWKKDDTNRSKPNDPLQSEAAITFMGGAQRTLFDLHRSGVQETSSDDPPATAEGDDPRSIAEQDLQTLVDVKAEVIPERIVYTDYDGFDEYRLATRMLSIGKYWNGPNMDPDYRAASEVMKEELIRTAERTIRMSQMDLISAWKKNWSDHTVCLWLMEALLANTDLVVQVVVSPLDAGAGVAGDQYSFGSGASRTFDLIEYYMTHDVATDAPLDDPDGARAAALQRLYVAPFYFTDLVPDTQQIEGETYKWPNLSEEGYTATLKQPPLDEQPPRRGHHRQCGDVRDQRQRLHPRQGSISARKPRQGHDRRRRALRGGIGQPLPRLALRVQLPHRGRRGGRRPARNVLGGPVALFQPARDDR